jgi:serine/threonine protein phosphatase PrpC
MSEPQGQGTNQEGVPTVQTIQPAKATAPAALELRAAKLTDVGQARPHNEDYVDFSIPSDPRQLALKGSIFMVADGMGGHQAGEVASKGAVEAAIAHYQADTSHDVGTSLVRAFRAANQQLHTQAEGDASKGGMGTTLVAAVILGRKVYVANVGDSRAYLINNRSITQITEDHSWVEEQVRAGLLNEEQARRHPQRNLVTRALGSKPAVEVDLFEGEIAAGDTLLLCSDGLTGRVADQEIANIVREQPASEAARQLVALANERGGNDNITVLIISAEEATPTVRAPLPSAGKPQPARRSQTLPMLAVIGGLLLLGAVAVGVLAATGILRLPSLQDATRTPTLDITLSPAAGTTVTAPVVTSSDVPTVTATLIPTVAVSVVPMGTGAALASPLASPTPSLDPVTLIEPDDGVSVTSVVTFAWDFGPDPLSEGLAFQLTIGRGVPPDPGALLIQPPTQQENLQVDLGTFLTQTGDYYWTVVVVETEGDGRMLSRPTYRTFEYLGPATPGPATSPTPGGG